VVRLERHVASLMAVLELPVPKTSHGCKTVTSKCPPIIIVASIGLDRQLEGTVGKLVSAPSESLSSYLENEESLTETRNSCAFSETYFIHLALIVIPPQQRYYLEHNARVMARMFPSDTLADAIAFVPSSPLDHSVHES
jgi:hypothetical protein